MKKGEPTRRKVANAEPLPDLYGLHERHPGFYHPVCEVCAEAAGVSLSRHHKGTSKNFDLLGPVSSTRKLSWRRPSKAAKASLKNQDDATRDGAYSVALTAIEAALGLFAISRLDRRTGADYLVGTPGQGMESARRLEVSGTQLDSAAVSARLAEKIAQVGKGDLPAIACVVGFKVREVVMSPVNDGDES